MDPQGLRAQATSMRRAADRLTLLRLRLSSLIAEAAVSAEPAGQGVAKSIHDHWIAAEFPSLGRIAGALRAGAKELERAAQLAERSAGRRLGGYGGAGFLGRGNAAHRQVWEVASYIAGPQLAASEHGASIGGYPLAPDGHSTESFLAHPSHSVGIDTPAYEGPEDVA